MSMQPGQIVGSDLSPNANILGTQIADKTLLFRNFSEDVFKIIKSGEVDVPVSFGAHGASSSGIDTALGATITFPTDTGGSPIILYFITDSSRSNLSPISNGSTYGSTFTSNSWRTLSWAINSGDSAGAIQMIQTWATGVGGSTTAVNITFPFVYFVLQQTATIS